MGHNDQGLASSGERYRVVPRVLLFVRHRDDVLLLKGAPDKRIWANKFNGVGGHVEVDEDVFSAARREAAEETGLTIEMLDLAAVVNIDAGDPGLGILMFVFVGWSDIRQTSESHEGALHWFPVDQLPKDELVEDLKWLLPRVLGDRSAPLPLYLHYSYDSDDRLVIRPSE
ncbi:MAG: NUDIX domain-containing protein [Chloroflexota bacterium]|nr:MAG: NUDIX domain-containing protein [Chloroflexota bacterium]